jgi:pimeloyl-ACP methyl ester carboxylesterase
METTSRAHRIHYTAAGDPDHPTLLLIHGILQSTRRWADMGYLDTFSTDYRVVAVDLLGHGDSDKPTDPEAYTIEGHLQDLLAVLEAEQAQEWHVWGYSGGAVIALALAAAQPLRTLSTIVGGAPPNVARDVREAFFGPWIDALRVGDWAGFWQTFLPMDQPTKTLMENTNDTRAVAAWLTGAVATADLPAPGDVPTLLYMGDKEIFFDDARATARHLGADFAVVTGRGHSGAFQDLAAVEPIARSFLERASRTTRTTR